jgi:hypothetical protein
MARKLPPDFNADWYLSAFPDVAVSGLDPKEHYLRFGRKFGRPANGKRLAPKAEAASASVSSKSEKTSAPTAVVPVGNRAPVTSGASGEKFVALVERPPDFVASETLPAIAPPRMGVDAGLLSFQELLGGEEIAPLIAYARIMRIALPDHAAKCRATDGLFTSFFPNIANAWHTSPAGLRVMISGATDPLPNFQPRFLRAYQAGAGTTGELKLLGEGIRLPAKGPAFFDIELDQALMPLLLEVTDEKSVAQGYAFLPFPSLLAGGLHGVELRALQTEADPMDAFWSLSERLLADFLKDADPKRSIASVRIDRSIAKPAIAVWLGTILGLDVQEGSSAPSGLPELRPESEGLQILLPQGSVPTISALVSSRLQAGVHGSFLIAEAATFRPRWSVTLPAGLSRTGKQKAAREGPAVPLAIILRDPCSYRPVAATEGVEAEKRVARSSKCPSLTVLLSAWSPERTAQIVAGLQAEAGGAELEILVKTSGSDDGIRSGLDELCGTGRWKSISAEMALNRVARTASHEMLLTISDRVSFAPGSLATLCALLNDDPSVASASCVAVGEPIIRKHGVQTQSAGGLFPAGWSFVGAPHLSFSEPDVLQALGQLTYPVVANSFLLTVWRKSALSAVEMPASLVDTDNEDLRIGLQLTLAGHTNLCTTDVQARLLGNYVRRDLIDPIGMAHVPPDRSADVLNRVTLLRELA